MNYLKSLSFLGLLLAFSMYSYWLTNRDYKWIVPFFNERAPAAVRESKDFEQFVERPMRVFKRELVASSVMIQTHEGQHSLSMGQFPVTTAKKENLICLEYPYMRVTFSAEVAALGGRKTQVIVAAPCKVNQKNPEMISNIPLPFGDLSRRPAQNQEFRLLDPVTPVDVRIENVFGDWPTLWHLENIEFFRDANHESAERITISSDDLRAQLGEPVSVK